ncbi:MAG: hypothetical protein N3G21_13120 [Candidatus Hydrogenedentes bacterium]|nr:hypothetical protein [Candidatus Hydrogenedentota bacterium]
MKFLNNRMFSVIFGAFTIVLIVYSAHPQELLAGFSIGEITPEIGMEIPGGFNKNISTGIHDPLEINVIAIKFNETFYAFASFDALVLPNDLVGEIRKGVSESFPIPSNHIILSATHTHSGGPVADIFMSERNEKYCTKLKSASLDAILTALKNLKPISLAVNSSEVNGIAFNRRFYMKDGTVETHPGKMNPNIIAPAGPVDPQLLSLYFIGNEQLPYGAIVNYSLHTTVIGGNKFSADYIYYLRKFLRERWGQNLSVVFLNGACGDVTQVNNLSPESTEFGEGWAIKIGETLALKVYEGFLWREPIEQPVIKSSSTVLDINYRDFNSSPDSPHSGLGSDQSKIFAREKELLKKIISVSPTVKVELSAIRIGNIAIITNPTEMFCRLGLDIKKSSPARYTILAELTNGYTGYCPTPEAFVEGGYEIQLARSSCMEENSALKILKASRQLLSEIFR